MKLFRYRRPSLNTLWGSSMALGRFRRKKGLEAGNNEVIAAAKRGLAQEIVDDMQTALQQSRAVAEGLKG